MKAISRSVGMVLTLAAFTVAGAATAQPRVKQLLDPEPETAQAEAGAAQKMPPKPAAPPGPDDQFERGVPRTSVEGFLAAADAGDWERAAEYLDLRNLPRGLGPEQGAELARQLKVVLDRVLWIDLEVVSDHPKGHAEDELPSYRDYLGRIETPDTKVDVLLQRVPRGDGVSIWKFSNATVAEVPALYKHHGFGRLGELRSELIPPGRFLGIPVCEDCSNRTA
jgi:MscS family membrane protein